MISTEIVLVAGGRVGIYESGVFQILDAIRPVLNPQIIVIHGNAGGIDRTAGKWAGLRNLPSVAIPIDSNLDGHDKHSAPKKRNIRMFETTRPHTGIFFPGGGGTNHAMTLAEKHSCRIITVEFDGENYKVFDIHTDRPGTLLAQGRTE